MRFDEPLIEGTLIRRYKRFFADVKLNNGEEVTVHCANSGSLMSCSDPGSKVLLSPHVDPRKKLKHQLEIVYAGKTPVGIHTGRPSSVIVEALGHAKIAELSGYATLRRQVKYGRDNHIDIYLEGNGLRPCYIEVKNVTLAHEDIAYFPDALTEKGIRELADLVTIVREGNRAMVIFVAQRADVEWFRPADHIDPEYAQAFRDAVARGVEATCYRSKITRKGIEIDKRLPIDLGSNN